MNQLEERRLKNIEMAKQRKQVYDQVQAKEEQKKKDLLAR